MRDIDRTQAQLTNELVRMRQRIVELEAPEAERKRPEEQVQQQNDFLSSLLNSVASPLYVIDANDYTIKWANPVARLGDLSENPLCYVLTHQRGRPCGGVGHVCPLKEVKKTKKPVLVEHTHYDEDGNARNIEVHAYPRS